MARNPIIREPHAKVPDTGECVGCRETFPYRELTELHEDNHDNLTYFHSDRLCGSCADAAGVEY